MYKKIPTLMFGLLAFFLTVSFSFSFEKNLILQGTAEEIHDEICASLKTRKFAKAEEILNNLLTSRRKSLDGTRMLENEYALLTAFDEPAVLDEWCASRSQSHLPFAVRGNYLLQRLRELRGTSSPRLLDQKVRDSIDELTAKAQADFENAYSLNPADPAGASGMVTISLVRGYPPDIMDKWFNRAIESDPIWMKPYEPSSTSRSSDSAR